MKILDLKEIPEIIPIIAEWHHEEWAYLHPNATLENRIEKYGEYLGEGLVPSAYVACKNNVVMGSASLVQHDMKTRMEYSPWLASVYVHPEHRNKGVGTKLVSHTVTMARENNLESLYLFTPDKENFYKRLGWSTIHIESYSNTQVVVMSIKLREK